MAFVPVAQHDLVAAWFALLQELTDAAWGGAEPTPGLAKLAWWQEELAGWARGARRHPLGTLLQPLPAPWAALARSLPSLQASRAYPGESPANADMAAFADAVAECERALFATEDDDGSVNASALVMSSLRGDHRLFHPETAAGKTDEAVEIRAATRPRRIHAALVCAALRQACGHPRDASLPPWRALMAAWRGARGG